MAEPPARRPPGTGFRIRPPLLKVKSKPTAAAAAAAQGTAERVTTDRWTKSGAFQTAGLKVTPAGAQRNTPANPSTDSSPPSCQAMAVDSHLTMDKLQLLAKLGRGASGEVRLARHKDTGEMYAVKKIDSRNPNVSSKMTARVFEMETKRLLEKHPNLVTTYQAFVGPDESLVLVQELMDVGSLERLMRVCERDRIKVPEEVISVLARQMLTGLHFLHSGRNDAGASDRTMHRDMKPDNILLNTSGECKLADFGTTSEVTTAGRSSFVGTTTYMSPERIKGSRYGTAADIWAVGLMVLELARGEYPFEKGNFVQLLVQVTGFNATTLADVPERVKAFVHALMKADSTTRPTATKALDLPFIKMYEASGVDVVAQWLKATVPELCAGPDAANVQPPSPAPTPIHVDPQAQ
eukprot:TRINITY_DN17205_c1_g1_i1.p1 TRINITY_DN17205_c1_g1~~TRINITY_DN17205_c1_g1_i1.p1  ORF type:complete len:409 (+),score=133.38 TRINITY_DN17205_c1_g1_i1:143-1369(+)